MAELGDVLMMKALEDDNGHDGQLRDPEGGS